MQKKRYFTILLPATIMILAGFATHAQTSGITGKITSEHQPLPYTHVTLQGGRYGTVTDSSGVFLIKGLPAGSYTILVAAIGYKKSETKILLKDKEIAEVNIVLTPVNSILAEVVVSGTMKEISRLASPVPVEVYSACFFRRNPTPSVFEALQNVNGVRPQINCNVCNTGDIHINGMEGPYTMVLIDGMPMVSGLSTVYGLSGIPQSLIERIEIVRGPASTLYGSEAVGGLINIITRNPVDAPAFSADVFGTTWGEINTDLAGKFNAGGKARALIGVNYFNFQNRVDHNQDGFTDIPLQNRISVFNKWRIAREKSRVFSLAGRYVYEDRWGGDLRWNKSFRGGDSIYGESIYTKRWELFGTYQLPVKEKILFQFSANGHYQNSEYGNTPYHARQHVNFSQVTWNKNVKTHDLLMGLAFRYTYYDDNTPATASFDTAGFKKNRPAHSLLPGIFLQDNIRISDASRLLLGIRYDYHSIHKSILSPRLNFKWNTKDQNNILRISLGNGYRVANIFSEDHAALTGARKVTFLSDLKPETSWNGSINFTKRLFIENGTFLGLDAAVFYTYFTNKLIADYDTDPNRILYDNLKGHAVSRGVSVNLDIALNNGLKFLIGGTYMDVYSVEANVKTRQMFTERFSGVWNAGYTLTNIGITIDYTGNIYSPMRLPLLSALDPRREYSPWWSIQNLQITKKFKNGFELYGGIKNLLNWTPARGNPFIIARTQDPFDKKVRFDTNGQALVTPDNPYGLTFDPSYVYAPNQGIRGFLGIRYTFR